MTRATERPEQRAALGANVRLRTYFLLLGVPTVGALVVLLGGAVWGTRERVNELEQLKRDGTSIAGLERVIISLAEELRETAASLAPDQSAGDSEAEETLTQLAAARMATDTAFARGVTSLRADPTKRVQESAADPDTLRALLTRMRRAENELLRASRAGRRSEAHRAFVRAEYISADTLAARLVTRFGAEQLDLEEALTSLAKPILFNRLTLGSTRRQLESLKGTLFQLRGEMALASAFNMLVTDLIAHTAGLSADELVEHPAMTEAVNSAFSELVNASRDDRTRSDLHALRPEIDRAILLSDSADAFLRRNNHNAAAALVSGPLDSHIDKNVLPRLDELAQRQIVAFDASLEEVRARAAMINIWLVIFTLFVLVFAVGSPIIL